MDDNNNYTEGEDNLEMEANDIELPSPDLVELASMLDEDSSNNNTEGEDNMEPADDNVDPDTGEMEVNEMEQETVMDDDRKSNEIQKDNNEETSMDVNQNNKKPFAKNERNKIQQFNKGSTRGGSYNRGQS